MKLQPCILILLNNKELMDFLNELQGIGVSDIRCFFVTFFFPILLLMIFIGPAIKLGFRIIAEGSGFGIAVGIILGRILQRLNDIVGPAFGGIGLENCGYFFQFIFFIGFILYAFSIIKLLLKIFSVIFSSGDFRGSMIATLVFVFIVWMIEENIRVVVS